MKRPLVIIASTAALAMVASSQKVSAQSDPFAFIRGYTPATNPEESEERLAFDKSIKAVEMTGKMEKVVELAREEEKAHPDNPGGPFAEGVGLYFQGDFDGAEAAWKPIQEGVLRGRVRPLAINIAKVRKNFPGMQLKPLVSTPSEAIDELQVYYDKAKGLLKAQKYDEIERTAKELQDSNASNVRGDSFLDIFFDGLSAVGKDFGGRKAQLAAWQKAKPKSALARLAAASMWVSRAGQLRGNGYADTITPEMQAGMDEALEHAAQAVKGLPPEAANSPLTIRLLLRFGRLVGMEREQMDAIAAKGIKKFPNYLTTYQLQSVILLPKWYGEEGDSKAFIEKRADQIGGDEGDIFYARLTWGLLREYPRIWTDLDLSYSRFQKGLRLLVARHPGSTALRYAALSGALQADDWGVAKAYFAAPDGEKIDPTWDNYSNLLYIEQARMNALTDDAPVAPSVP